MTRQELLEQLTATLEELFDIEPEEVKEEARLYDDLDIDSIDTMDLVLRLRQQRNAEISQELFKETRTVGQVLDVLESLDCDR